ncbi:MAG: ComF family protein [Rhodocyclaceae bacterium]|nr:ComF family protein [Rhodocyclaceae bacterium]
MDVPRLLPTLSNRPAQWRSRLAPVWNALLPAHCIVCALPSGGAPMCTPCRGELPAATPGCPRCAVPGTAGVLCGHCQRRLPAFDWVVAGFTYAFPVDQLIQRLKYAHDFAVAQAFSRVLIDRIERPAVDLLVPVPLHRSRLRERGFNQAVEIARPVARAWGRPLALSEVQRVRPTVAQAGLSRKVRRANLRAAFGCTRALDGLRVLMVDDVMTTGATLDALARCLKQHGAAEVGALVVARTPPPR